MSAGAPPATIAAGTGISAALRRAVIPAAVLGLLLAALDATVVGTVMPDIVADVGGAPDGGYAWLVSGFLLAQIAITPLAGWLADRLGERFLATSAAVAFLIASGMAGSAHSFAVLLLARVVHGLAAGALVVSSYVIVGTRFGAGKRAAAQSLLSTVWGVAAVAGPVAGSAVADTWGWRWIFLLNVPLAAVVVMVMTIALPGRATRTPRPAGPAFPGVELAVLVTGCASLLLAAQAGSLGLGTTAAVALALAGGTLLLYLRRAGGTLVLGSALRRGSAGAAALATAGSCVVMYGLVTVLPVRLASSGSSQLRIALVVGGAAVGWVAASGVTGSLLNRTGYRTPMTAGAVLLTLGGLTAVLDTVLLPGAVAVGLGTGAITSAALALLQDITPQAQFGTATSTATLLRNLGAAVGINAVAAMAARHGDAGFWLLVAVAAVLVLPAALVAPRRRQI